MKNCLKLGDRVKTLVEKVEHHSTFKVTCPKGTIATVCHIEDDFIMVEVKDQNGKQQVLAYAIDQIELIKE